MQAACFAQYMLLADLQSMQPFAGLADLTFSAAAVSVVKPVIAAQCMQCTLRLSLLLGLALHISEKLSVVLRFGPLAPNAVHSEALVAPAIFALRRPETFGVRVLPSEA